MSDQATAEEKFTWSGRLWISGPYRVEIEEEAIEEMLARRAQCQGCGEMLQGNLCVQCNYVAVETGYGPVHVPLEQCIKGTLSLEA